MKEAETARRSGGKVAKSSAKGFADAAKSGGTKKTVRISSAMSGRASFMSANVKYNRRCKASSHSTRVNGWVSRSNTRLNAKKRCFKCFFAWYFAAINDFEEDAPQ